MPSQIRDGVKWPKLIGNRPRAACLLQTLEPQKDLVEQWPMGPTSTVIPTFLPLIMSPSHYLTVKKICSRKLPNQYYCRHTKSHTSQKEEEKTSKAEFQPVRLAVACRKRS